ncbi:hypothetical protein [Methylobacterium nigriterrae]|uniref:hypothetical protein n=1 Tax=Methylobacterium nigriterrae TaxID=3127512 RepID=UPI0030137B16
MPYTLDHLAPGSYDLLLDGEVMGSIVREVDAQGGTKRWSVELLDERHPLKWPHPFTKTEHTFQNLKAVVHWLGDATVVRPDHAEEAN